MGREPPTSAAGRSLVQGAAGSECRARRAPAVTGSVRTAGHTPACDPAQLRAPAVRLLLEDAAHNSIAPGRVTALARAHDVTGRTVRRRIENARANGGTHTPAGRPHFEFTEHRLTVLARRHGNITRTHLELTAEAKTTPGKRKVPSRATFHGAVKRRLNSGQLAGMRGGEAARRSHDVFGKREHWPPTTPPSGPSPPATSMPSPWNAPENRCPSPAKECDGESATTSLPGWSARAARRPTRATCPTTTTTWSCTNR
ncbi:hypothetical protein GCM10010390_38210 [Streptomyces mordarskii]|uniref:Transposase n=1 Tax=Streptomyces mordarskii TaxID=1226758 RepID=A0ABP3N088_9ACTN